MCLAASAAAARLSVAAVVSGMSLSTPESNAITGMSVAWHCSSSGRGGLAVQRREADRVRLLGQGVGEHRDLRLDLGLGGRALEGDASTSVLGGLLLGTLLDGLPELVLEALGDDGDVGLVAARCRWPARRTPPVAVGPGAGRQGHRRLPRRRRRVPSWCLANREMLLIVGFMREFFLSLAESRCRPWSCVTPGRAGSLPAFVRSCVGEHGDQDDEAEDHVLPLLRRST